MLRPVQLEESWKKCLGNEFEAPYMVKLREFLLQQKSEQKVIFPKGSEIFAAFNLTPLERVKVVIIGQDPYHGPGQAQGLCFSVAPGVTPPPSLKNIFKELANDLADGQQGVEPVFTPEQCSLVPWAEQGVLLLNAVLTVERSKAGSHQGKGWELFTDKVVQILNEHCEGLVFILWGSYAQKKGEIIDRNRHLVLTSVHPSPLSAHRGYFGGKHFSKANAYLKKRGQTEIDWLNVD